MCVNSSWYCILKKTIQNSTPATVALQSGLHLHVQRTDSSSLAFVGVVDTIYMQTLKVWLLGYTIH